MYNEFNKTRYSFVSIAREIIKMHNELEYWQEENKELKEKLEKRENELNNSYDNAQKIHNSWVGAVLNGDLAINS